MRLCPLGDTAVTVELDSPAVAAAVAAHLIQSPPPGVTDVVAAFSTVALYFDPLGRPESLDARVRRLVDRIGSAVESAAAGARSASDRQIVEIPVRYGGADGPDLPQLARERGLDERELIRLHSNATYEVLAVGFMPGFAYLGGLATTLHAPRRQTPRTRVPAGSVGIGGSYTGVYPFTSPGGWNIIGRTSTRMFDPHGNPPARLQVGQKVRFVTA